MAEPHPKREDASGETHLGVVLGAGGGGAWAFHLGVARAIEDHLGVGVASASRIIGTSAGASIGGALACGASIDELLAAISAPPSPQAREDFEVALHESGGRPKGIRRVLPHSLPLVASALRGKSNLGVLAAGLLPRGFLPTVNLAKFPMLEGNQTWPESLWVPAVRVSDGSRMVFGRDDATTSLSDAIEASSAVPGLFRPKEILHEGRHDHYLDGATHSATNADLLAEDPPSLVVISSAMTRPGLRASRILARRQLQDEIATLSRAKSLIVAVEPDQITGNMFKGFSRGSDELAQRIHDRAKGIALSALRAR
jgi:NTE family protein